MATCCVTGHRNLIDEKHVFEELYKAVNIAVEDGFTHFVSGFASGTDLLFAMAVADLKKIHTISLEAAIPCPGRMDTPDKTFQELIKACDIVKIHSATYSKSCYMRRNKYMVDSSQRIIAVFDGRKTGGTASTLKYARAKGKEIILIEP